MNHGQASTYLVSSKLQRVSQVPSPAWTEHKGSCDMKIWLCGTECWAVIDAASRCHTTKENTKPCRKTGHKICEHRVVVQHSWMCLCPLFLPLLSHFRSTLSPVGKVLKEFGPRVSVVITEVPAQSPYLLLSYSNVMFPVDFLQHQAFALLQRHLHTSACPISEPDLSKIRCVRKQTIHF